MNMLLASFLRNPMGRYGIYAAFSLFSPRLQYSPGSSAPPAAKSPIFSNSIDKPKLTPCFRYFNSSTSVWGEKVTLVNTSHQQLVLRIIQLSEFSPTTSYHCSFLLLLVFRPVFISVPSCHLFQLPVVCRGEKKALMLKETKLAPEKGSQIRTSV